MIISSNRGITYLTFRTESQIKMKLKFDRCDHGGTIAVEDHHVQGVFNRDILVLFFCRLSGNVEFCILLGVFMLLSDSEIMMSCTVRICCNQTNI